MVKDFRLTILFDTYSTLLTNRQQEIMKMSLNYDNSLAEIAEELNISRQTVKETIVASSKALYDFEKRLGLCKTNDKLSKLLNESLKELKAGNIDKTERIIESTISVLEE